MAKIKEAKEVPIDPITLTPIKNPMACQHPINGEIFVIDENTLTALIKYSDKYVEGANDKVFKNPASNDFWCTEHSFIKFTALEQYLKERENDPIDSPYRP